MIHHNFKIYLDYLYSSVIYSTNDYESRYSKEIETKILNSIEIKNRKNLFWFSLNKINFNLIIQILN